MLEDEAAALEDEPAALEDEPAAPMLKERLERYRPKSFEEVLGQEELVSTLTRRVITKDHSRHIVLHGPEGSGKITLARLYSQALQCAAPIPSGSPCQNCAPCKAFDPIGGFNYVEIDAKKRGDIVRALDLRNSLRSRMVLMLADWSAIVVKNADRLSDSAADNLLKAVEEHSGTTTFIFEALGPDSVSCVRAMQSFLLTIYLRALCSSPPIGGEPNPAVDYMPPESWGFVVDGLRHRARTMNMTLDELGSVLVSFWADSRVPPIGLSVPLGSETAQRMTFGLRYLSFHDLLNEARTGEARYKI
jgi:hypothetical protein